MPLLKDIPTDAVIIDVGAHAGQFTKLFSKLAPKGIVYAIEPAGYARSILTKVVHIHGLKNVQIIANGFGDTQMTRTLHIPIKASGSLGFGLSHVGVDAGDKRATYKEDIHIEPLDDFANRVGLARLDLIKADIEGFEMRLLKGAEKTIARFKPMLILEINDRFLKSRAGDSALDMWNFLKSHGYQIEQLGVDTQRCLTLTPSPNPVDGDIICRKV